MFHELLTQSWHRTNSCLCVGIDPELDLLPRGIREHSRALLKFGQTVVDSVSDSACAVKMNHAHFASVGREDELEELIRYVHVHYPQIPVILDAKRGDVASTALRYAEEVFLRYGANAVTVNPFLGWDVVEPFLEYADRGVAVLCRTSNPGSAWIQDFPKSDPIYLRIARKVQESENPNLLLVAGATHLNALKAIRHAAPDVTLLVPGVGAQGGSSSAVMEIAPRHDGLGLIVNCSRSITNTWTDESRFAQSIQQAAIDASRDLSLS